MMVYLDDGWHTTEVAFSNQRQEWHVCPCDDAGQQVGSIEIYKHREDAIDTAQAYLDSERCECVRILRKDHQLETEIWT